MLYTTHGFTVHNVDELRNVRKLYVSTKGSMTIRIYILSLADVIEMTVAITLLLSLTRYISHISN